jgi:hypothetical protein
MTAYEMLLIHFHFHPTTTYKRNNSCHSSHYINSPIILITGTKAYKEDWVSWKAEVRKANISNVSLLHQITSPNPHFLIPSL